MITPRFNLSQSESELTVTIQAPFARIHETEINIEEKLFIFYSSPYYLRLHLPGNLIDSEKEVHKVKYDADEGSFVITCVKQTFGEHFPGLDMITNLLTAKGADCIQRPLIEVVATDNEKAAGEEEQDADFDWFYEQKLPEEEEQVGFKYGFANSHSNVFSTLKSELSELVDVEDPDKKLLHQRRKERLEKERQLFSDDHYLADLFNSENIDLHFQPDFYKVKTDDESYTAGEEDVLLKLPRKELLVDKESRFSLYLSLVDILFAWCYNHRITSGENCVESAWNIAKLSPTLTWLDCFSSLRDVSTCCVRRSLIFPLVRNWEFSIQVLQDTVQILSLGKKRVLKCLLETHTIFNHCEPYYILNQLYITDYCLWVQTISENKLISLADSLRKVALSKEDMSLDLCDLEAAAHLVQQQEEEERQQKILTENLNNVVNSLDQLSVIENVFALGNDNEGAGLMSPYATSPKIYDALEPLATDRLVSDSENESDSSDSDDSSEDDDSEESDGEDSSNSDSSSDPSLDSNDNEDDNDGSEDDDSEESGAEDSSNSDSSSDPSLDSDDNDEADDKDDANGGNDDNNGGES